MTKQIPHPLAEPARLKQTLTLFGRNTVLEAFQTPELCIDRLHLADSNRPGGSIAKLIALSAEREIPVLYHSRQQLSRISKNGKQDQGVAADIFCPQLRRFEQWCDTLVKPAAEMRMIALDGLTNPQNLGMSIRSCHAAGIDAILLSGKGSSGLNPLAIKASAGTAFNAPLVLCESITGAIEWLVTEKTRVFTLSADAKQSLYQANSPDHGLFVLGNETDGVSAEVRQLCTDTLSIPMHAGVESLNVAVTAALVAYAICHPQQT